MYWTGENKIKSKREGETFNYYSFFWLFSAFELAKQINFNLIEFANGWCCPNDKTRLLTWISRLKQRDFNFKMAATLLSGANRNSRLGVNANLNNLENQNWIERRKRKTVEQLKKSCLINISIVNLSTTGKWFAIEIICQNLKNWLMIAIRATYVQPFSTRRWNEISFEQIFFRLKHTNTASLAFLSFCAPPRRDINICYNSWHSDEWYFNFFISLLYILSTSLLLSFPTHSQRP